MKSNLFFVENADGRQFAVKLLQKGDAFGLDKCLIWEHEEHAVEFYDATYAGDGFDEVGQFVSRYYVTTILKHNSGLILYDDIPDWRIDENNIKAIQKWIKSKGIEPEMSYDEYANKLLAKGELNVGSQFVVMYDYIGDDSFDCSYGLQEKFDTREEAQDYRDSLRRNPYAENIQLIEPETQV